MLATFDLLVDTGDGRTVNDMARRRLEQVVADDPRMLALWDAAANTGADPALLGSGSSRRRFWRCPVAPDHRWEAGPHSIARSLEKGYTGCPCCAGRKLSVTNSFAARYPTGVALWHPARNGSLRPDEVLGGSPDPVWWKCPQGPDHEWQAAPLTVGNHSIAKGNTGCPFCANLRPSVTNNLTNYPQLLAEFHPAANDVDPASVVATTTKKLWWRCLENPEHEWRATGGNRVRGRSCPFCRKSLRSVLEIGLAFELQTLIAGLDLADDKVVVEGVIRHVDLLLRDERVVIEVDGRWRHDGDLEHERDARKTRLLTEAGFRVLRVREEPLRAITPADVVLTKDPTIKVATDAVLAQLRDLGWLDVPGTTEYLAEAAPRRQQETLEHVRRERPGKVVKVPGPVRWTRTQRWEGAFACLLVYVEREGHANVPYEHVEDEFTLGKWVGAKRMQRRRGRLSAERERLLEALPGWTWDAVEDAWELGFQRLLDYQARVGHIRVPTSYRDDDGYPLGTWVRSHRREGGGRRTITDEQQTRLEALPGWTYEPSRDVYWERAATAFEAFAAREGHCRTPRYHREDGIDLDGWSKQQRAKYHRGGLPPERASRLEAVVGWSWTPQEEAWEVGFAALVAHVAEHGTAAVRRDETRNGYPVGSWAGDQRNRHTRGTLDPERRARLEALAGWTWDPHGDSWERHYDALLAFVAREGHARVPTDHVEGDLPLASWVIRHRQERKIDKVPGERAARLEALPGWTWDVLAARWDQHFAALERFASREGHARVPNGHVQDGLKLGRWVIAQRQGHRNGDLAAEREARLEAVAGWAWDMRDVAWDTGLAALATFQARTGHCQVPRGWLEDDYRLSQWLGVQRAAVASGRLRADRHERLVALLALDEHPGLFAV